MSKSKYELTKHSIEEYIDAVRIEFERKGKPEIAEKQAAYMRDKFVYYGLPNPVRSKIILTYFRDFGVFEGKKLSEFILTCMQDEYREMHYLGIQMLEVQIKHQPSSFIQTLEKAICLNSWWDSVDTLAKQVGIHLSRYPELQIKHAERWIDGDNMWLQRIAIIHQLFYRDKTNEQLLYDMITRQASNSEFFIRKACGWALRQYAKTNPKSVRKFINKTTLSPLTVREAEKQLQKAGV